MARSRPRGCLVPSGKHSCVARESGTPWVIGVLRHKIGPHGVPGTAGHALLRIREVGTPWVPKQEEAKKASAAILKKGEAPPQ